jgi:hypothetical protein
MPDDHFQAFYMLDGRSAPAPTGVEPMDVPYLTLPYMLDEVAITTRKNFWYAGLFQVTNLRLKLLFNKLM